MTTTTGPLEFMLFAFDGEKFREGVATELVALVEAGLIRIVDLAVVSRDADGVVTILELQEYSPEVADAMIALTGDVAGLLSEADLIELAEQLEPGTTSAALLYESLWARRFAEAIRGSDGTLLMSERIPHAVVEAAREGLIAAAEQETHHAG